MMEEYRYVVVFSMELYLSMLLCFHWNVFNIHTQMLSDYTLIWFIETKSLWHKNFMYGKTKTINVFKKCEKAFEILRSEWTCTESTVWSRKF